MKLANRQARISLTVALAVGLGLVLIQIWFDYQNEKRSLDAQVQQLIVLSSPSATESVWTLSNKLADSVTKGAISHPLISKASIRTINGVLLSERSKPMVDWHAGFVFLFSGVHLKEVELYHPENESGKPIGVLSLVVDPVLVREEFISRVEIFVFSGFMKIFILGGALIVLFQTTLTTPIQKYANWIASIDPKKPESWLNPKPYRKQKDELKAMADETQQLFQQAHQSFNDLETTRQELEELNVELEARVQRRTKALEEALSRAEHLATTDELTGLANRRSFMQQSEMRHAEWLRYKRPYSLLMIDVDNFKQVNDTYGHDVGDKVLVAVATELTRLTRKENIVGRLGGEEFCILIPGISNEDAFMFAERLRQSLENMDIVIPGKVLKITASFGLLPPDKVDQNFDVSLKHADNMLYEAKRGGRNRVCVYQQAS